MIGPDLVAWGRESPAKFAATIALDRFVVINVHVPNEGEIAGTDLTIPYDSIASAKTLPADRSTPIALYCRSGRMSTIAARALLNAGYTNVVELAGGMNAWTGAGRVLLP